MVSHDPDTPGQIGPKLYPETLEQTIDAIHQSRANGWKRNIVMTLSFTEDLITRVMRLEDDVAAARNTGPARLG